MKLVKSNNNEVICDNLLIADSFFRRFKGLMFTKNLPYYQGLYIKPCNSIHTFFMNYSIDVLYVDKNHKILAINEEFEPGRIGPYVKGAKAVIELPAGKVKERELNVGQALLIEK